MTDRHAAIAAQLAAQGWCIVDDYYDQQLLRNLQTRVMALRDAGELAPAGIGRGRTHSGNAGIRRDNTRWLDTSDPAEAQLLAQMEMLRTALNEQLMLGLFYYEAHFALYESGAFYKRHIDAFPGQKNRIISSVLYLNDNWQEKDGGQLALYENEQSSTPFQYIVPEMGRLVLFLSEEIPHEVMPAHAPRISIAGWFRCNDGKI